MDPQVQRRLTRTVQHYPFVSLTGRGDRLYNPVTERACYIEGKLKNVVTAEGEQVISSLQLYFNDQVPITSKDKFKINGEEYLVKAFSQFPGVNPKDAGSTVVYL